MKLIFALSLFIVCFAQATTARGQVTDEQRTRRREFVENLMRGLIESQTPPPANNQLPPNLQPQFPKLVPNSPLGIPGRPTGNAPVAVTEMESARLQLDQWSAACLNLINELRFHEQQTPQLRPLLADALQIQASIDSLRNQTAYYPTLEPLMNNFAMIDRDWRMLAYRLQQSGLLSSECSGMVEAMNGFDASLCRLLKIQPQLDRHELLRLATGLSAQYKHLLQDVYYQAGGNSESQTTLQRGQELFQLVNQSTMLIERGSYDSVAAAFQNCLSQWRDLRARLRSLPDQRIHRDVQEIELIGRQIQEILWLPVEMDRDYVSQLAASISAEVDHLFRDVSLQNLLTQEQPELVLSTTREFQDSCNSFARGINSGKSAEDLAWDFWLFEKQWNKVNRLFRGFKVPAVDQHLDEVRYMITTLGQSFGSSRSRGFEMDYHELVQIAANLDQLCQQLSAEVKFPSNRQRYDSNFLSRVGLQSDALCNLADELHRDVVARRSSKLDRQQLANLFQLWNEFRPSLNKIPPAEQPNLLELRRQIEPLMVKLQVVYTE